MSPPSQATRRGFLIRVLLGCAGAISVRFGLGSAVQLSDATLRLALHVVQATGTVASLGTVPKEATVPSLLATVFDGASLPELGQLNLAQLQQLLAQRIQQDYQKGALTMHQGWWLARSEAAILQLRGLLAQQAQAVWP